MMSKRVILPRVSMNHEELFDLTGRTGSYFYMAPEVLHEEAYNEKVPMTSWKALDTYLCNLHGPKVCDIRSKQLMCALTQLCICVVLCSRCPDDVLM